MDKLSGTLDEDDFTRVYAKLKADRAALERQLIIQFRFRQPETS